MVYPDWVNLCVLQYVSNVLGPFNSMKQVCKIWNKILPIYSDVEIKANHSTNINVERLFSVIKLNHIKNLDLYFYSGYTDHSFLRELISLESISFNFNPIIKNNVFSILSSIRTLKKINFSCCCCITCNHIRVLAQCKSIRSLDFWGCNINDDMMKELSQFKLLEELYLGSCSEITDNGFKNLISNMNLRKLYIYGCDKLTDAAMVIASKMVSLEYLDIRKYIGITDDGIEKISILSNLATLCLPKNISGVHLTKFRALTNLDLGECQNVFDSDLEKMGNSLHTLKILYLTRSPHVGYQGLIHLSFLRELYLNYCEQLMDNDIQALSTFHSLNVLHLSGCMNLTGACLETLCMLPLHTLHLKKCVFIACVDMKILAKCGTLYELSIGENKDLNDENICDLCVLKQIRILLIGCEKCITDEGIELLRMGMGMEIGNKLMIERY